MYGHDYSCSSCGGKSDGYAGHLAIGSSSHWGHLQHCIGHRSHLDPLRHQCILLRRSPHQALLRSPPLHIVRRQLQDYPLSSTSEPSAALAIAVTDLIDR